MSPDYLTDLNKKQRRAVKHGIDCESATKAPPLLVIAGAGSGKTKTLAHRVAHLVVSGVDPHRILDRVWEWPLICPPTKYPVYDFELERFTNELTPRLGNERMRAMEKALRETVRAVKVPAQAIVDSSGELASP